MLNDVNQSMKKVQNPITNQSDLVQIMSILVKTVENISDYFDNGAPKRFALSPTDVFLEFLDCFAGESRMRVVSSWNSRSRSACSWFPRFWTAFRGWRTAL